MTFTTKEYLKNYIIGKEGLHNALGHIDDAFDKVDIIDLFMVENKGDKESLEQIKRSLSKNYKKVEYIIKKFDIAIEKYKK